MDEILKESFIREESSWNNTMKFHLLLFLQWSKFGILFFFFFFEVYFLIKKSRAAISNGNVI